MGDGWASGVTGNTEKFLSLANVDELKRPIPISSGVESILYLETEDSILPIAISIGSGDSYYWVIDCSQVEVFGKGVL
jgi:hypothetical protein